MASFTTATDLPGIVSATPNVKTRFLGSTIRMAGVGGEAYVSGGFDDVSVDGLPYDDFNATTCLPGSCGGSSNSGPMLNPAKWGKGDGSDALELVRESERAGRSVPGRPIPVVPARDSETDSSP